MRFNSFIFDVNKFYAAINDCLNTNNNLIINKIYIVQIPAYFRILIVTCFAKKHIVLINQCFCNTFGNNQISLLIFIIRFVKLSYCIKQAHLTRLFITYKSIFYYYYYFNCTVLIVFFHFQRPQLITLAFNYNRLWKSVI